MGRRERFGTSATPATMTLQCREAHIPPVPVRHCLEVFDVGIIGLLVVIILVILLLRLL
jgi:hypothetical protein